MRRNLTPRREASSTHSAVCGDSTQRAVSRGCVWRKREAPRWGSGGAEREKAGEEEESEREREHNRWKVSDGGELLPVPSCNIPCYDGMFDGMLCQTVGRQEGRGGGPTHRDTAGYTDIVDGGAKKNRSGYTPDNPTRIPRS